MLLLLILYNGRLVTCTGFGGGGPDITDVWKHLANSTPPTNGVEDNHKVNGTFGSLAGVYAMDPATAYSMMPGKKLSAFVELLITVIVAT